MDIFGGKRGFMAFWRPFDGFMAFWRHFRPFGGFLVGFSGNMVGKWTDEPHSEVDEVVNHFWVLTMVRQN